jgi:hypothetical protein
MKVNDMVPGQLYQPKELSVYGHLSKGFYTLLSPNAPHGLKRFSIWKTKESACDRPIMLYLGHTRENWYINGISKHHWFLIDGDLTVLNNHSFRNLEKLYGGT